MRATVFAALALATACQSDQEVHTLDDPPVVTITSHDDRQVVREGSEITLAGMVVDAQSGPDALKAEWMVNDAVLCAAEAPNQDGRSDCAFRMPGVDVNVRLSAQDEHENSASAVITLVAEPGDPPVVQITSPTSDTPLRTDVPLNLVGNATDAEDPSPELLVWWESNVDGKLVDSSANESGDVSDSSRLTEGSHTLTLWAEDTAGMRGSDTVTLEVGPANTPPGPPTLAWEDDTPIGGLDDLVCLIMDESTDEDGDEVTYRFTWTVDGAPWTTPLTTTILTDDTVPGTSTLPGQEWECTVTPFDGTQTGTAASIDVTVDEGACGPDAPTTQCDGAHDGADYLEDTSMGGPNLNLAMKYVAPDDMIVRRLEVFTGEKTGTNRIAVWSHDATRNQPDAELAGEDWSMDSTNSWQGADLPAEVSLSAGDEYWVVWSPINGSQASLQEYGGGVDYRGSFDGGSTWNGPYNGKWKLRVYCCEE